ncbi:MAG: DUF5058 family protein [candidate division NC10 bacterium]|nr:DUF5058 family protein [candidate division NC10 bacterium]
MSAELLKIINSFGLWVVALIMVSIVFTQAGLYARQAFRAAAAIQMPREKCLKGLRAGMITAVGPSIAIVIIMIGMMAVVGAPITWMRLSIIGAAPTELTAATLGAKAVGVEFGSPQYDLYAFAASNWGMALNDFGWLFITALFATRLESVRKKVGGGNPAWLALLTGAAAIGAFAYLMSGNLLAGGPRAIGVIAGGLSMVAFLQLAKGYPGLKEYTLGLAMLVGMFIAAFFAK